MAEENKNNIKAQIISGKFGEIVARQKADSELELGEILVCDDQKSKQKMFLQVYDMQYGSQISQQNLELISGMNLEENADFDFFDKNMRNYKISMLKNLFTVNNSFEKSKVIISKSLPDVFSNVRAVTKDDLDFLTKPKNSLFFGNLRSGSKAIDVPIYLDGENVLTHHVLISGTTGKGKSVLMSNLLWDSTGKDYCALLVLDPHDEYYGRDNINTNGKGNGKNKIGLKDHPSKNVVYYTSKEAPQGTRTLKINIKMLRPAHFGCLDFSDAQEQAMNAYYREHGNRWIEAIILEKPVKTQFVEQTLGVIKRRLMYLLDLDFNSEQLFCNGIFDVAAGENTIRDICEDLERSKTVIVDTSSFSGQVELLIGSLVVSELFNKYRFYKTQGMLHEKPVVSVVLEEAPRVLGKDILEKGSNIFSTIAREGRKFKVGLVAITQLPSLIPREILANMNTKIILGTEMSNERQAIIDSASQDLSEDSRSIASLDKGECIISSNFAKFAIPVKIPFFDEFVKNDLKDEKKLLKELPMKIEFSGIEIIEE